MPLKNEDVSEDQEKVGNGLGVANLPYCLFLSALFLLPFCTLRHYCNLKLAIGNNFYLKFAVNIYSWHLGKILSEKS